MIIFPMKLHHILLTILLISLVLSQSAADDLVDLVIPNLTSNWYSGYFNISGDKDIHYVFFQSQKDKNNDPLILYLGNGPGCSSLYAMLYQNGPFTFKGHQSHNHEYNKYGWNMNANLLYLESPAGVGFSKGNPSSSDHNVTTDNLNALTYFFTRFPTYLKNDLYIAGTGYAGIYGPYLALRILQHNENPIYHSKINIKGLLLGNPCTNFDECYASGAEKNSYYHYEFLYNHGFLDDRRYTEFRASCALEYNSGFCYKIRSQIDGFFDKLQTSVYNIYAKCYNSSSNSTYQNINDGINDKCQDLVGIKSYLNDPSIQEELHVNQVKFNVCDPEVFTHYLGNNTGSYWIYPRLISKNQKLFIYSGDLDSSVPVIGTKLWVTKLRQELDIPVKKVWRQWWTEGLHQNQDQVGGMVWELNGLTYATVKGSGFMVGREKPKELYEILKAFLTNSRLPSKK